MYVTNNIPRTQIPNQSPTSTVLPMSYAGPASRTRGSAGRREPSAPTPDRPIGPAGSAAFRRPAAPSDDRDDEIHETDWQRVALFGAGLAIGLTLGAGAALLAAPQTGEETRAALRSRARRITHATGRRSQDAWEDLRDELRSAARSLRRRRAKQAARKALQRELEREAVAD
jgi:gas vesicle protein